MGTNDLFLKKTNGIVLKLSWLGGVCATGGLVFDYISKTRSLLELLMIFFVTMGLLL